MAFFRIIRNAGAEAGKAADVSHTYLRRPLFQASITNVLVIVSILVPVFLNNLYWVNIFLLVNLYVVPVLMLNYLVGDAGQISFGQGAIFGIGAYGTAVAATVWNTNTAVSLAIGVILATVLAGISALPALRVQGYYLGFVTLGIAMVFNQMLSIFDDVTGGPNGLTIPMPSFLQPVAGGLTWTAIIILLFVSASIWCYLALQHSRFGNRVRIARDSPEAARTMGLRPHGLRVATFLIAGFWTGIAGALYVPLFQFVGPSAFELDLSLMFFFAVILGGTKSVLGSMAGIWVLYLVPNVFFVNWIDYRLFAYGAIILIVMFVLPEGIFGSRTPRQSTPTKSSDTNVTKIPQFLDNSASTHDYTNPQSAAPFAVSVKEVSKSFGSLNAVDSVSLNITHNTVHGLVGTNGSGKTTLLNLISGLYDPDSGVIELYGEDVSRMGARGRATTGVGRTFQTPKVVDDLTVWENLTACAPEAKAILASVPGLKADLERDYPTEWQHTQRRLLEIVRVIVAGSRTLLLDEPAAGLSVNERAVLGDLIRRLRDVSGKTVLVVEHDLKLVWNVADRVTVMDAGQILVDGPAHEVATDPIVTALFTGDVDAHS